MKNTNLIVNLLRNNPQGIIDKDIYSIGLTLKTFSSRKSEINNNKNKWKSIQIIRQGKNGNSIWRLAETNPQATITYGTKRAKTGIRTFINRMEANTIALSSESNAKARRLLAAQIIEEAQKLALVMKEII